MTGREPTGAPSAPANDEAAQQSAFMSALATEHFALQAAASTTVSEAAGRAALYLPVLSSSLVAGGAHPSRRKGSPCSRPRSFPPWWCWGYLPRRG
jgi:hypothetical protein